MYKITIANDFFRNFGLYAHIDRINLRLRLVSYINILLNTYVKVKIDNTCIALELSSPSSFHGQSINVRKYVQIRMVNSQCHGILPYCIVHVTFTNKF